MAFLPTVSSANSLSQLHSPPNWMAIPGTEHPRGSLCPRQRYITYLLPILWQKPNGPLKCLSSSQGASILTSVMKNDFFRSALANVFLPEGKKEKERESLKLWTFKVPFRYWQKMSVNLVTLNYTGTANTAKKPTPKPKPRCYQESWCWVSLSKIETLF